MPMQITDEEDRVMTSDDDRADSSRTRETGGAGLGLSICKAIAGTGKGTIHINSGQGRGTEVSVIFPSQNGE